MTPCDIVLTPTGVRFWGRKIPTTIGSGGICANKVEGDGGTPVGTHTIVGAFFRPDRLPCPMPCARPIGPHDLWCDASNHADYNQRVQTPFAASHEVMRRADPMYDIVLVTDWNYPNATAGKGSAIFLHQWRRRGAPTAGCLAFSRQNLRWICARIQIGTKVIVTSV